MGRDLVGRSVEGRPIPGDEGILRRGDAEVYSSSLVKPKTHFLLFFPVDRSGTDPAVRRAPCELRNLIGRSREFLVEIGMTATVSPLPAILPMTTEHHFRGRSLCMDVSTEDVLYAHSLYFVHFLFPLYGPTSWAGIMKSYVGPAET